MLVIKKIVKKYNGKINKLEVLKNKIDAELKDYGYIVDSDNTDRFIDTEVYSLSELESVQQYLFDAILEYVSNKYKRLTSNDINGIFTSYIIPKQSNFTNTLEFERFQGINNMDNYYSSIAL